MKTIPNVHNNFFIASMENKQTAINFLRRFLPAYIRELVDLDSLEVEGADYYDDGLRTSHSDVLYRVKLAGVTAFILIVLEHQSKPDKWMPLRMLKYKISAAEKIRVTTKSEHLPVVYNMCFYHDADNKLYPYSTDFFELFGEQASLAHDLFFQPFDLIDVNKLDDEELLTLKEFGLMAYSMKYGRSKDEIVPYFKKLAPELQKLDKEGHDRQYILKLIEYLFKVSSTGQREALYDYINNNFSTEIREGVMSIAGDIFKDGETKGIAKGEHKIVSRQLQRKFGQLSPEIIKRLESLAEDEVLQISDRLLDADSIDDVFPETKH